MHFDTDVLIVGAGAAGLIAALNARGRRVCVLQRGSGEEPRTASDYAQGGIAAAVGPGDSTALHVEDTLDAGCRQNFVPAVELVCREAPGAVSYLQSLGVAFARDERGVSLHQEAAHCRPRVLHVGGDATGAAIMQVLRRHIADATHIERLLDARAVALLCDDGGVCGIAALTQDGRSLAVRARDVVIATGGVGGLFSRSTNPPDACGDGLAIALAAGARCEGLEFVQFHPTALDVEAHPLPLLTEALRGSGARLIDDTGEAFMRSVHALGELAPRDVVARAIHAVQSAGGRVWLDATRLIEPDVAAGFPLAYRTCRAYGIDAAREPIPVTPAAHYHMGGIAADLEGRASLPGLWAVGEAACTGLHGANRLASNSLLEAVVFGRRVGDALCRASSHRGAPAHVGRVDCGELPSAAFERELREMLWRCMGLSRSASGLAEGLTQIARLRGLTPMHAPLRDARLLLAERMLLAAARRRTSCGAHYRSDDGSRPIIELSTHRRSTARAFA